MVKMISQKSAILIHLNTDTLSLWDTHDINETANLINTFVSKLENISSSVFLSVESDNELSNNLKHFLSKKELTEVIPFQHELNLLRLLMLDRSFVNIIYFDSIFPMLDLQLTENLLQTHEQYGADYSYGENVPPGILPPIFGKSLFEALRIKEPAKNTDDQPDLPELSVPLSSYLEKNLNNFHVEIHYEHPDLRIHRLNYSGKTQRSLSNIKKILSNIADKNAPYKELQTLYAKKPELLSTFPSYIELEISNTCEYHCTFCAREIIQNDEIQHLKIETIEKIISYCETGLSDTSIALGGYGEPLEHPEIEKIIDMLLDAPSIKTIILETNALHLNKIFPAIDHKYFNKLQVVININSIKEYTNIHGTTKEAENSVHNNLKLWSTKVKEHNIQPQTNTHLQILKIVDNESEVDDLFSLAEKLEFSFLLQKYNSVADKIPQKRISDMTPMERSFCWHLRRDLFILANGDIVFCKQDIDKKLIRGNVYKDSLDEIWQLQKKDWISNYKGDYSNYTDCAQCDEYFTFNL